MENGRPRDALTKISAKPDALLKAVETGQLAEVDTHPPFRTLLKHRAYLTAWLVKNIPDVRQCVYFLGEYVHHDIHSYFCEPTEFPLLVREAVSFVYSPSVFLAEFREQEGSLCDLD